MALPILPRQHWRSRLLYSASNFVRAYRARRGFYRITTAIRRGSRRYLGGSYMPVAYRGGVLWINPGNDMDSGIFSRGVYEPGTIGLIERLSRAGYSYVDVGGNIGSHVTAAALARSGTPGQTFTVFEPSPYTLPVLRQNLRENRLESLVTLHELAASAEPGELCFYATPEHNPGSGDGFTRTSGEQVEIRVPVVRLDDVLPPLPAQTLLKIDVEGGEPGALAGASRLLATPGLVVLFEHNTKALESAGFARGAVTGLLTGLGFHLFELNESTGKLRPFDPSSRDFCNCAAVRSIPAILAPLVTA